jgi:hypothetical protein
MLLMILPQGFFDTPFASFLASVGVCWRLLQQAGQGPRAKRACTTCASIAVMRGDHKPAYSA